MNALRAGVALVILSAGTAGTAMPPLVALETAAPRTRTSSGTAIEQLRSPQAKVRAKAAREIAKSGDASAVPALVVALGDTSVDVRREVVLALAQIRVSAALDALVTATRDTDPDVRTLAVQGLSGYYTGVAPSAGFSAFVKKQYRRAKSHFVQANTRIDPGVSVEPQVVAALVKAMNDTSALPAAREAAKGLGILVAQAAVPDLVERAHSTDVDLARESLNALAKIKDRSAGPKLIDLLDSSDKDIKRDAAVTTGILRAREALPKLQAMFENDPDQKNKEKALEGLAYLGEPVSVPLFTQAIWREDKALRASAAEGLARAGDASAVSELEKAVSVEKDAAAKLAAEYALTALGKEDFLAAVVHELASKLRGDVAEAYLRELTREAKFLPRLYPFLSEHEPVVRKRLATVLMFTGDQSSLQHLERLTHDSNPDVASEALRAARAIRARSSPPAVGGRA